jgi:hypothetical protein
MKTVTVTKLSVPNWKARFEKSDNKKCNKLSWLAFPLDSDEWNELADHSKNAIHLLAWIAILRVAARCEPRGTLLQTNGRPHDAASLSKNSGLSVKVFEKSISIFLKQEFLISEMVQVKDLDEGRSQCAPSALPVPSATGIQVGKQVGITNRKVLQEGITEKGQVAGPADSAQTPEDTLEQIKEKWSKATDDESSKHYQKLYQQRQGQKESSLAESSTPCFPPKSPELSATGRELPRDRI